MLFRSDAKAALQGLRNLESKAEKLASVVNKTFTDLASFYKTRTTLENQIGKLFETNQFDRAGELQELMKTTNALFEKLKPIRKKLVRRLLEDEDLKKLVVVQIGKCATQFQTLSKEEREMRAKQKREAEERERKRLEREKQKERLNKEVCLSTRTRSIQISAFLFVSNAVSQNARITSKMIFFRI